MSAGNLKKIFKINEIFLAVKYIYIYIPLKLIFTIFQFAYNENTSMVGGLQFQSMALIFYSSIRCRFFSNNLL